MKELLIKPIVKVGNSAGVILPREWLNGKARIELYEEPLDINKDVLELIKDYMEDIMGVYLVGSYSRNEQEEDSDIDILVISNSIKKEIISGRYNISIYTLDSIEKTLKNNVLMILPRLLEAKVIFNKSLLERLKNQKINKESFKEFIDSSKRILKINKDLFNIDKKLDKNNIYSLILRLRGFFIISCLINRKPYSKAGFKSYLEKHEINYSKLYLIYKAVKLNKPLKEESYEGGEKLINLLEQEIISYGK
jgi:predicted nucleotidyltransferase